MKMKFTLLSFFCLMLSTLWAQTSVEISDNLVIKDSYENSTITIAGKTDLHLTAENALVNSNVYLNSTDSWLFFDNIRPTKVVAKYASNIFINGVPFNHKVNGRIAVYRHGTVVIPHNGGEDFEAMEVFTDEDFGGASKKLNLYTFHNDLGEFDNAISSFKLKRGYSAVFANHTDGTGYSRVFVADTADLEISLLPIELNDNASFIRVSYWQYPNKKGLCNKMKVYNAALDLWQGENQLNLTESTWYYSWGNDSEDFLDYEFVTMKWGGGSTDGNLESKVVSHFLGYNEPDGENQSNLTVERAIELWPGLLKGGLRLGSPSPVNPTAHEDWLGRFMAEAERLNYRVDFITLHCYWEQTPEVWYSKLKEVYDRYKRPIWITEGHTKAGYPYGWQPGDALTGQQTTRLNRLHEVIQMLDTCSFVERYALYNWDDGGNVFVTGDFTETSNTQQLTTTGEFYRDNRGPYCYNANEEYVMEWQLNYDIEISSEVLPNNTQVKLNWNEINDELVVYSIERKLASEDDYIEIAKVENVSSYTDDINDGASYRIRMQLITDSTNKVSNEITVNADVVPAIPVLSAEATSTQIIDLNWNAIEGARTYTIQRSNEVGSGYLTIVAASSETVFRDTMLEENTTYYYKIAAENYAGISEYSNPLEIATKHLTVPAKVEGVLTEPGNAKVRLDWGLLYDATYTVKRSDTSDGSFDIVASDLTDTAFFDTGLENEKTYYYVVSASNDAGEGLESEVVSARPYVGPIAFWNFNEAEGDTSIDIINSQVAKVMSWSSEGKQGAGMYCDGTRESYTTMPDGLLQNVKDFTITMWINMQEIPEQARLFDFRRDRRIFMEMVLDNGDGVLHFQIRDNANTNTLDINYKVPKNQWVHLAVTQKEGFTSIYVNGDLKGTMQSAMNPSHLKKTTMNYINKSYWTNNPNLTGTIDDFNIYEVAFSQSNIVEEMSGEHITMAVEQQSINIMKSTVYVYPNPVTDYLYLGCDFSTNDKILAELYNMNGQRMMETTFESSAGEKSINVGRFERGLYYLKLTSNRTTSTQKIIFQ